MTNTAKAIDPISRTLLTELQVPNETGELFPGAYALITLQVKDNTGILTIPSNALLFRSEGPAVGLVGQTVRWRFAKSRLISISEISWKYRKDYPRQTR